MDRYLQYEQRGRRHIRKPDGLRFQPMLCCTLYGIVLGEKQHFVWGALQLLGRNIQ